MVEVREVEAREVDGRLELVGREVEWRRAGFLTSSKSSDEAFAGVIRRPSFTVIKGNLIYFIT